MPTQHLAFHTVACAPLTPAAFRPYGVVLNAMPDGMAFSDDEASLDLSAGIPRFYVMRLVDKQPRFSGITRHRQVTQCLAAVGGVPWQLAVARPAGDDARDAVPTPDDVVAFDIPGDVAVLLHRGTWHAGPFFEVPSMSFFNLELSDTNIVDHDTHHFSETLTIARG